MTTPDKKNMEIKKTVDALRTRNQQVRPPTSPISEMETVIPEVTRQRVSPGSPRIKTIDRQGVLHNVMRDILLGKITPGQALKKLRVVVLGLKQDEYARLVDVSRKTLSEVENDKGNYSAEIINRIYKPFGLEIGLVPISKSIVTTLLP